MTAEEIAKTVQGELVCASEKEHNIKTAFGSDMMSDVMAFYHDGGLLITGLINIQVGRTASLLDLAGICFVRGKHATCEMKSLDKRTTCSLLKHNFQCFLRVAIYFEQASKKQLFILSNEKNKYVL